MQSITFKVDGLLLSATVFVPGDTTIKHPAILFIHGWESKQDRTFTLAEDLAKLGYTCLTFDLRGHGSSEGDHTIFSRQDFLRDVVAAYDVLATNEGVDPTRIFGVGSSFGSYLAALLSAERPLQGVGLRVPADYRDRGFDEPLYTQRQQQEHSEWKNRTHAVNETAALRALHTFAGNVLIVESECDELVPATTVRSYRDAVVDTKKLTYKIMTQAPHSISRSPELQKEFSTILITWLGTSAI